MNAVRYGLVVVAELGFRSLIQAGTVGYHFIEAVWVSNFRVYTT
jgi:hypothetical protein